jgi:hypothetical protein
MCRSKNIVRVNEASVQGGGTLDRKLCRSTYHTRYGQAK